MSANIDTTTGKAAIAYTGARPWHGMGQKIEDGATIDEWRVAAGLDWSAVKVPVEYQCPAGQHRVMSDRYVIARDDTGAALGVCSGVYKPVQPADVIGFFQDLVEELDLMSLETAGALAGGRKIWGLAKTKQTAKFGAHDVIDNYLLLATSYDSTIRTKVMPTSVRVVCQNTLSSAYRDGGAAGVIINHRSNFDAVAIKEELRLTQSWLDFEADVHKLISTELSRADAREYLTDVFYPGDLRETTTPRAIDRRIGTVMDVMDGAPGQDLATTRGTVWGALNAVTYYVDHESRSRRGAEGRLDSSLFGTGATIKETARDAALALCA